MGICRVPRHAVLPFKTFIYPIVTLTAVIKLSDKWEFVGVTIIKVFFDQIRKPSKNVPIKRQIVITLGVILLGFSLGVFQKWIDGTGGSSLPSILQQLDIGNYFGRLAR